jgi:glucosamine--fructose-6-phosphate aminotransferase (isomerizing)
VCGIVGYVGYRSAKDVLVSGLEKLEYRGYDSAGISVQTGDKLELVRAVGNLSALKAAVDSHEGGLINLDDASHPTTGIGHTRWATHGRVCHENAHPHYDNDSAVHVVVNGIVENYLELKAELQTRGAIFTSETDAEVIAHLISENLEGEDLAGAVCEASQYLRGHYAFVAMSVDEPNVLVGARKECPLIVGRGEDEQFVASAIPAFLAHTKQIQVIEDDEIVVIKPEGVEFLTTDGEIRKPAITEVDWDADAAEKGGYETFMMKEIHEQPDAVAETLGERVAQSDSIDLGDLGTIDIELLRDCKRIIVLACGTSYHAGLVGRYVIEEWARVPVEMDIASEFRYRNPVVGEGDLVIGITQSGETLDTLAAMRIAREQGAKVLAITNVMGSQATRDADGVLYTRAGIEIGVAATKTFVAQVTVMYLLALRLAEIRGTMDREARIHIISRLKQIPDQMKEMLARDTAAIDRVAEQFHNSPFFLYLGRHLGLAVCLEGALKLKEISYIATDSYAAGEMKHGPIALLDENTPVVVVATESPVLSKVVSNIQEVKARGANVIAVASEGSSLVEEHADTILHIPKTHWMLQPLLAVVPLQLLAYRIASLRGLNVDQPRNLAKTVTVE